MKSDDNSQKKDKVQWITIGELWKTKSRPDMLRGKVKIEHLGLELEVVAFIKSKVQKKYADEADVRIVLPMKAPEENPFD